MTAHEYFLKIGDQHAILSLSKMFGATCYKTPNGKAAAFVYHDYLVVKLEPLLLQDALTTKGAKMFEPMPGRPMNGWVMIPFSRKNEWNDYIETAADFVRKLPAKEPKAKKSK